MKCANTLRPEDIEHMFATYCSGVVFAALAAASITAVVSLIVFMLSPLYFGLFYYFDYGVNLGLVFFRDFAVFVDYTATYG